MADVDKICRSVAELRSAGWVTSKDLAEAGYVAKPNRDTITYVDPITYSIAMFKSSIISKLEDAIKPSNELGIRKKDAHNRITNTLILGAVGLLIRYGDDHKYYISPDGVKLMEYEEFLVKRRRAVGSGAKEELRRERPAPRSIGPDSVEIAERKGRSIE